MSSSSQETGALYLGCWGCTCWPGSSGVGETKRTGMSLFQSHRGGDTQGPGQGIPTAVMHPRVLLGTCSSLDAEAPGKSFRKYVLIKTSFTIMFKTELNGKQQRGGGSGGPGTTKQPACPSAPAWPPGVSPGSELGSASPCIEASSPGPSDRPWSTRGYRGVAVKPSPPRPC